MFACFKHDKTWQRQESVRPCRTICTKKNFSCLLLLHVLREKNAKKNICHCSLNCLFLLTFLPMAIQPKSGLGLHFLRFLNHTQLDTRWDSPGRVISPSQRPLPTQDNTTYKHKRQTSMRPAGFEPANPATERTQTYALDGAATEIGVSINWNVDIIVHWNVTKLRQRFSFKLCEIWTVTKLFELHVAIDSLENVFTTSPTLMWNMFTPQFMRGVMLTTHPYLVPRSWMSRSYTSSPPKRLHGV
jgi:hypothetical protein